MSKETKQSNQIVKKLLADRLLVKPETVGEERTHSGIILPVTKSEESAQLGKVVAISDRIKNCEQEYDKVYVGDKILYSTFAGTDVEIKGVLYKLMRITDVMSVV